MQTNEPLNAISETVGELVGCALADPDGVVLAHSDAFDADIACATVALCQVELDALASELGLGALKDWAMATGSSNLYVSTVPGAFVLALGTATSNLAKTSERLKSAIRGRSPIASG